jgi:hypothetical protein
VREQRADWDDPIQQTRLYRRTAAMIPNSVRSKRKSHVSFRDVWQIKNMCWQVKPGALAGIR